MIFWKRFIADLRSKTQACSLTELGAYDALLDEYYVHECALPDDLKALYRICRALDLHEKEAVDAVIQRFFFKGPDGLLHNKKADEVIAKEKDYRARQAQRGSKGAQNRWHRGNGLDLQPTWWRHDEGIRDTFKKLGLSVINGESLQQAKERCFEEINRRKDALDH